MIDGVHFGESVCVVALGIDAEGVKHPLALVEGATENATVVTELLTGLRERGLEVTRPILIGIDGATALRKAVSDVFDSPVIQRCQLDKTHPSAAGSLREGMVETLTVLRLGLPPTLARTLRSTNAIESMISICRDRSANVKRWRDGQMALRWCAAGMLKAGKQFRRVNGHLHLPKLRAALDAEIAGTVVPAVQDEQVDAA